MSYTPINWQTGDTITAEKLNKMDNGWRVETSGGVLFSETVTTELEPGYPDDPAWGDFAYSEHITADTITVTFDGVDYTCTKMYSEGSNVYGGWDDGADFTNFPFAILSDPGENAVCTATAGTHTVSVSATTKTIETSTDFEEAVGSVVDTSTMPFLCVSNVTTMREINEADSKGRILYFRESDFTTKIIIGFDSATNTFNFMPSNELISAKIVNGIFTVYFS